MHDRPLPEPFRWMASLPDWQQIAILIASLVAALICIVITVRDAIRNTGFFHEEIASAAIKYHDLHGVIISLPAPARHHHVMWARHFVDGKRTGGDATQGFLTTNGRFVDRVQGLKIATKRGQIVKKHPSFDELYSEDMWPDTPKEAWGWSISYHGDRPDELDG